jgi:hypothetical protein
MPQCMPSIAIKGKKEKKRGEEEEKNDIFGCLR